MKLGQSGMRVADVVTCVASKRYDGQFRNTLHAWDAKHSILVFVITESGVVGVGEAWCDRGAPETVASLIDRDLKKLVVGEPVFAIMGFWKSAIATNVMSAKGGVLYAATSAIDIALWDAFSRCLDLPLHALLGSKAASIAVYASGGMYGDGYGPASLASDMKKAVEYGCGGVKIKGGGASISEDVARAAAVRQKIGPDARLMVDVLFSLDVPAAIRLAKALGDFDLHFLEAPTARENLRGWAEIRRATGMPLAGTELESGLHNFRSALEIGAIDYLQADATVCGGITELKRVGALAHAFHRKLTLHCSGSAVALAANAQAGAAIEGCESVEMHLMHQTLFEHLWNAGYRIADGRIHLPDAAGLGLSLRPDDPGLSRFDVSSGSFGENVGPRTSEFAAE